MLKTSEFNFELPENLIAHQPFFPKEETKMLVFDNKEISDAKLINLLDFLQEGDVIVFNDARVIKAQLSAIILRSSATLEFNLTKKIGGDVWEALCYPAKRVIVGDILRISTDFFAEVIEKLDNGFIHVEFECSEDQLMEMLEKYGSMPLPPYIDRRYSSRDDDKKDEKNYQTIYAANGAAVAAPTAGLHFTDNIMKMLDEKKVQKVFVTLNVGAGTFLPVRSEFIKDHKMHSEFFVISQEVADIINAAKLAKKRVIAVGTTSLRVLESVADENGLVKAANLDTEIFIYPPYKFKVVDILMTNFHLPQSTLFMLICAFVGKKKAFEIYKHAIENKYRFYSYGDTSLLFKNTD